MRKLVVLVIMLATVAVIAFAAQPDDIVAVVTPEKISSGEIAGSIFSRADMLETIHDDGNVSLDVTTLSSSDGRFGSGMYKSGKKRAEFDAPYGVDEFMYFVEGGVTLTSADGSVQTIGAGEAVTIPKEWTGTWETEGYTSIRVIYSDDGSGL